MIPRLIKETAMTMRAFVVLLLFTTAVPAISQSPESVRVTAGFQAWADGNRDGILQPREIEELVMAALRFFAEPHPAKGEFDTFLDVNHDRKIGLDEIDRAWMEIVLPSLVRLVPGNPETARLVDVNGDGRIDDGEAIGVIEYLAHDRASLQPHKAVSRLDERVDANRNGRVEADEIAGFRERIVGAAMLPALEPAPREAGEIRTMEFLDELADVNGDGNLDPEELRQREAGMRGPHPAETPFDQRLDENGNGRVEQAEIERAIATQEQQAAERMAAAEPAPGQTTAEPPVAEQPVSAAAAATPATTTATTAAAAPTATTTTAASTGVTLEQVSIDEIFPVFRSYYDDHPIGTAALKNGGATAIENVKVELELKGYMDAKKPCTAPTTIAAGASGKVDLTAVFNDNVLKITEGTKALATVSVSWTVGGQASTKDFVQTVQFLKLNAMTWDDDDRAAAFVTANDPVVQQFRSAVVTNVDKAVTAVDLKLRTAMALHQTLVKYGLKYWTDPNAAYATVTKTKSAVDSLQFPVQTIQLKTGDCDDLAILACALLESAAVESAFVTVPGHIFVAFALAMKPDEAKKTFAKPDDLIFKNDKAWVPWEITALSGGFLKAWETGAKEWRASDAKGEAGFHPVQAAWKKYKPVAYPGTQAAVTLSSEAEWTKAYTEEVKTFINQQIATQVQKLQGEIKTNPSKPEYVNRLGVLYARYGLATEAEKEFLKLDTQDYVPALVNLGNLAFLKPDMKTALAYYNRAYKKEPANAKALLGAARANHEQENYGAAREAYTALKKVDATLASQYAYLDLQGTEADQAAKAGNVVDTVEWEEK
jgi:tetratricopeptide (TPR) repeat protein